MAKENELPDSYEYILDKFGGKRTWRSGNADAFLY